MFMTAANCKFKYIKYFGWEEVSIPLYQNGNCLQFRC